MLCTAPLHGELEREVQPGAWYSPEEVQGLGFGVQGFRVQELGFRFVLRDLGLRVSGCRL